MKAAAPASVLLLALLAAPSWAQDAGAAPAPVAPMAASAALAASAASAAEVATVPAAPRGRPMGQLARDPFERYNRSMYAFNDRLDRAVVRPVAEGYAKVVPELVRSGVGNFFGNLGDVWSAVNQLLQGKVVQGAQMTLRVATNTVFGLGGVLDPATEMGLERQSEDLGQTLGFWGVPAGPYLVLPVFGPSTVRDGMALPVDKYATSSSLLVDGNTAQLSLTGLQLAQTRAELLGASRLLNDVSLDPYAFLRDAYLARRRNLVWDGDPPDEPDRDDAGATR